MQIISYLCLYFAEKLCYPAVMKQILSKIPTKIRQHHLLFATILLVVFMSLFTSRFVKNSSTSNPSPFNFSGIMQSNNESSRPDQDTDKIEEDDQDPADTPVFASTLWITAINPGYEVSGVPESGELIELQRVPGSTISSISLAGYSLRYTNTSGTKVILYEFPEGSMMTGENLLMRLTRSPESDQSDATYSTTLAMSAGPLELLYQGEPVDSVCWTGVKKNSCLASFKKDNPTTLVRDLTTGEFSHQSKYEPKFDPEHKSLVLPVIPDDNENKNQPTESGTPHCKGLKFSEIYAYYTTDKTEQFVEVYNSTDNEIKLDGCTLRYKKKSYDLTGVVKSGEYFAYYPAPTFTFTKNPTSSNILELYDEDGTRVDITEYYHGQKKSTSYARFYDNNGEENWQSTYAPTPNAENVFQEFRSCPAGKVINPETGNCVKATDATSTLKDCGEGKYRSPITNRCRNLETDSSTLKPCAAGYERNPETNRCRKISSENSGADYALVPTTHADKTVFIAAGVVILLVAVGVIYIIFQYRRELLRALRKIRQRLHDISKHLISRSRCFHWKK